MYAIKVKNVVFYDYELAHKYEKKEKTMLEVVDTADGDVIKYFYDKTKAGLKALHEQVKLIEAENAKMVKSIKKNGLLSYGG